MIKSPSPAKDVKVKYSTCGTLINYLLKISIPHNIAEMESEIQIFQVASTSFESKMNTQFIQVKIGEQLSDHLMEIDKEFRQQLAKRDEEYEAGISKAWQQLQEAEERFKRKISEKDANCGAAVSDKQTLETSVLQLTDKINVISADFEAARKAWQLEKDGLLSQIVAARKETEEIGRRGLIAEQSWNMDKENLLSSLGRTYEKKIEELQTNLFSMATERGMLCRKNKTLNAEIESLKAQLNEKLARLAQMQDERVQNERVLQQYRTENIDLQSNLNDFKGKTQGLLRKIEEDTHLWDAEKSNLGSIVAELGEKNELLASEMGSLTQKNSEQTANAELMKYQVNALESELNESKNKNLELLQKGEEDCQLWDEKKSNLEGILAELQTKNEDLMLQLSRKKTLEEELLATVSSLEAMKESTSKDEIQIANLRRQLVAVAEKKDGQLTDIQRQLSVMAEDKKKQLASLQDELSSIFEGKRILEEENKSLRTELDRRTLVSEEEEVILERTVRELQTTFTSLNNELETSRAIAVEKERQLVDLQNLHSELAEAAKKCLENKNDNLLTELNRCTISSDKNIGLQNRIWELETVVESLKKESPSKTKWCAE